MDNLRQITEGIIDDVILRMCNDYCRYPREWDEDKEGIILEESEICHNCPLNML